MHLMFETILDVLSGSRTRDWLMVRALQGGSIRRVQSWRREVAVCITVLLQTALKTHFPSHHSDLIGCNLLKRARGGNTQYHLLHCFVGNVSGLV